MDPLKKPALINSVADLSDDQQRLWTLRRQARKYKDFQKADKLRAQLERLGVDVVRLDRIIKGPMKHV